ncbi:Aldo/keto reductase [Sistotremastrum suecicum HHB10207 ss-3]|uniref:Aldo/keto reductase n=1 Tax=Sistotremastrum suecicum HHB10207 ss-3 TaxID=1314776 RepID=A0A165X618_9AGAM|nr:Aldo/keto reductase [Sistotremastrum suecicum HHB10207 ss-3]
MVTTITLNDGSKIPIIAFGTWTAGHGQIVTDRVEQALDTGFDHIDTAQSYGNEEETGKAIRESGLKRTQIYVTTKFSGRKDVETSIKDSLKYLGLEYVDLYLVHHPRLANGDIPGLWKKMEKIKADGLAKSIGVSNFGLEDLKILYEHAKVLPVVNQIYFNPYSYKQQLDAHAFGISHGIVTEAYSALDPITRRPGGPVDRPLAVISRRHNVTPEQVLLAWVRQKHAVAVTYSSKKERLEGYLDSLELELLPDEIAALDYAGAKKWWLSTSTIVKRVVPVLALSALGVGVSHYTGVRLW